MSNPYPLPSFAASAWIAGDKLWLAFPPLAEHEQGHSVPFGIDLALLRSLSADHKPLRGIVLALEALRARHEQSTIGTAGAPTRHEVLRAMENDEKYKEILSVMSGAKARSEAEKIEATELLKSLGLS